MGADVQLLGINKGKILAKTRKTLLKAGEFRVKLDRQIGHGCIIQLGKIREIRQLSCSTASVESLYCQEEISGIFVRLADFKRQLNDAASGWTQQETKNYSSSV